MKLLSDCLGDARSGRHEIVAVMLGNSRKTIINGAPAAEAIKRGAAIAELIPRGKAAMMVSFGEHWRNLAESPSLFVIEGGKLHDGDIMKFKRSTSHRSGEVQERVL